MSSADKMFQCLFTALRMSPLNGEQVVLNTQENNLCFARVYELLFENLHLLCR